MERRGLKTTHTHKHTPCTLSIPALSQVKCSINSVCTDTRCPLTCGGLCEVLCVFPLLEHQAQGRLADRFPRGSSRGGEEVSVVLRDEAGGHVSGLKLWVARQTQQEFDVSVQSHDLKAERRQRKCRRRITNYRHCCMYLLYNLKVTVRAHFVRLTLYCRKQYRSFFKAADRSSAHTTSLAIIGS